MSVSEPNTLLTRKQTAELLGVAIGTLEVWAATKRYNLPYIKVGRLVKYRRSDIERFIQSRRVAAPE